MNQSYLKASIDGPNGSGKSGTMVRLAVGISKELCKSAPVAVADSEERWRFYKATVFDPERIPLIIYPGKTLVGVQKALASAEAEGCCVFVDDQLTTPWMEGIRAFSYENGLLPFDRRQQLMNQWEPIVEKFRYGKFHAIFGGRLGYFWENVEDSEGNLQLIQGDSKFNAGGGNNFGYEADLELEIRRRKRRIASLFRGKTQVEHVCDVIKDAAGGLLTGQQFTWPTHEGAYKVGAYKQVFDCFRPYLDFMAKIEAPVSLPQSSKSVIVSGRTDWSRDQIERKALLEELDANLQMCFPSGDGKSKLAKMFRDLTLEYLNGFISWSRMEEESPTKDIERNVLIIRKMRGRIEQGETPTSQGSLAGLLHLSAEDVLHPGHGMTLLEVMTRKSLPKRGPQPVIPIAEAEREDEPVA